MKTLTKLGLTFCLIFAWGIYFVQAQESKANSLFSPPTIIPIPATCLGYASAVKIADFNNDSFADILLVTSASDLAGCQLLIFLQNPAFPGTFNLGSSYNYPVSAASAVDVGDLNEDGYPEVVLGIGDQLLIFENISGTLIAGQLIYAGSGITSLKIGDISNDGLNEIVISSKNADCLGIFLNQGNLQFALIGYQIQQSSASNQVLIADLNNDGLNDVALLRGQVIDQAVVIWQQNSQGVLDPPIFLLNSATALNVLAIGYLDDQPGNDLVASSAMPGSNDLLFWSSGNLFSEPSLEGITPQTAAMVTGDFDGDGTAEIIAAHQGLNLISTLWCSPYFVGANTVCPTNFSANDPHNCLDAGDLNHDNQLDLCLADSLLGLVIMCNETISGLPDIKKDQSLLLYPNPFHDYLNIKVNDPEPVEINVYDALGQKISSLKVQRKADQPKTIQLKTTDFAPGFYTVEKISLNGKKEVLKVLKL